MLSTSEKKEHDQHLTVEISQYTSKLNTRWKTCIQNVSHWISYS